MLVCIDEDRRTITQITTSLKKGDDSKNVEETFVDWSARGPAGIVAGFSCQKHGANIRSLILIRKIFGKKNQYSVSVPAKGKSECHHVLVPLERPFPLFVSTAF